MTLALAVGFVALCVGPWLLRLGYPSLYADDVNRVEFLETRPIGRLLVMPFNEHLAPLFHGVSWAAWTLAGRRLTFAPLAFTLASYVPFVLALPVLFALLRRELKSLTAALVGVAVFSLTPIYAEAILWFSASSFMWALLGTLLAWLCAAWASESQGRAALGWSALSGLFAMLAPMFSALGLLAGPVGATRAIAGQGSVRSLRAWAKALLPIAGTAAYLAIGLVFRYDSVLAGSAAHRADWGKAIALVAQAVVEALGARVIGLDSPRQGMPTLVNELLLLLAIVAALVWAAPSRSRPMVLIGLGLIVVPYGLEYSARMGLFAAELLRVQRYHLFPQLGLACLVAGALRGWLSRFDVRPSRALAVACGVAGLLIVLHRSALLERER
ncbi:MAG TPA: hypothetical protein VGZ22_19655, partial [Isosphaeraceae bacterium]|nr:hypothetical protein [Isosphaeraceae bacterium]